MSDQDVADQLEQQIGSARTVEASSSEDLYRVNGPNRKRIVKELLGLEDQPLRLENQTYDLRVERDAQGAPLSELGSQAVIAVVPQD